MRIEVSTVFVALVAVCVVAVGHGADATGVAVVEGARAGWSNIFGGSASDELTSVRELSGGGYIVAGHEASWGAGNHDAWLIRLGSGGGKLWSKTFGGIAYDLFNAVEETSDGGYVVAGYECSWGQGTADGWVIKLSSSGTKSWSKTFGGSGSDVFRSVQQTADGGYIVAGDEGSWGQGDKDAWVVKLDASGNKTWSRTFGGGNEDSFQCVRQTSDGGYILAGYEGSWGLGGWDAWLMKLDSSGNKVWAKTFGGSGDDRLQSVLQTSDGGYIVAGLEASWGMGAYDGWVMKLDSSGGKAWSKTFGGSHSDSLWSVRKTSDGGYVAGGRVRSWGQGDTDGWVIKLSSTGTKTWSRALGGTSTDYFESADGTSDGGCVAAGTESSWGGGLETGWVVKLDSSGNR